MGWKYENLTNEELQRIAGARFGCVLGPLKAIDREVVIKKLKAHDRHQMMETPREPCNDTGGS